MEPIPTSFHLGPLVFHLYGIGLAIAAYVGYRYARRRLVARGIKVERFATWAGLVVGLSFLGARAAHVATNWSWYRDDLPAIFSIWQGGLASFGALALGVPAGIVLVRRWWPATKLLDFSDGLVVALVAAWALGRVLGPQFMYGGGGHLTHQWFGIRYAGQVGRRVPVPLIQALEDVTLWFALLGMQKHRVRRGLLTGVAMIVWGCVRSLDERLLLGQNSHSGSVGVQMAGLVLAAGGLVIVARQFVPRVRN